MQINCEIISKRFNYEWIFKDFSYLFEEGKSYAITGSNGSGKSTLLKILSGSLSPTHGNINYRQEAQEISIDHIYEHISFAAPYL